MTKLYGISNCDQVRAARNWLDDAGIKYQFVDFRREGIKRNLVVGWLDSCGDALINRRSSTWRQLNDDQKAIAEREQLAQLLVEHPTLIKRPVLVSNHSILLGFNPAQYTQTLVGENG